MTGTATIPTDTAQALAVADRAARDERWRDAIDTLMEANSRSRHPSLEERLVQVRHGGYRAEGTAPPEPWPPETPDLLAGRGAPPEVGVDELDATVLASGLQHHGALLVRGLLDRETARSLLEVTQRAMSALESCQEAGTVDEGESPWFKPFTAVEPYTFEPLAQRAARLGGGLLLAESPRALHDVITAYRHCGLGEVIAEYLGEWPALSVKKSTIRRATPESPRGWHQDGAFLGTGIHTVNVWTALTPCGVDAPGVELFARPFDHLAAMGTEGASFHWSVSDEVADSYGAELRVQPAFETGDALLFNQMTLHRTGIEATMTQERFALETWFLGPSTYPVEQIPLLF